MHVLSRMRGRSYEVNQHITIAHPTLGEIEEYGEPEYWGLVSTLTATSYDLRFQLDDNGIDYEDISDYMAFCMVAPTMPVKSTRILFGDLDLTKLKPMVRNESDIVLRNEEDNITIDTIIYELIVRHLRQLHGLKRNYKKAGNKMARQYYMQEERRILEEQAKQRATQQDDNSVFAPLITAMVNKADFKYDYDTVWTLPVSTFMESAQQVQRIVNYQNLMTGIYTGNIDASKISKRDKIWIGEP